MLLAKVTGKSIHELVRAYFRCNHARIEKSGWRQRSGASGDFITTGSSMRATKKSMRQAQEGHQGVFANFLVSLSETEFVPVHARSDVTKIRPKSLPAGHALTVRFA